MKCRVCESKKTTEVINLGKQPLANKYPKNKYEIKKEKKFFLKVHFCEKCKSGQIKKIINRNLMFEDYYYLSSVNKNLKNHFVKLSKKLRKYRFVVDIGSNDGILLEPLKKLKIKAVGIDASKNVGKMANKSGLKTYVGFFGKYIINKIIKDHSKPDLIVASSVITHLENPKKFAEEIKYFLSKNGDLIVEIEYLQNFIRNLEFERFYFDRPFYFSANSINILFKNVGMTLFDIEHIDIHGGSLRCYIKNSEKFKVTKRCTKILSDENKGLNINTLIKFNKQINLQSKIFKSNLTQLKNKNNLIIGYGAPARVATITNVADINSNLISYIIDDSPLKQNKFSPGKHIKILPKTKNINKEIKVVVVFAYEYFNEIKKNFKKYKIKFFKPIPFRRLT